MSHIPGFQSFPLTGFEAFGATELESRALPQLFVFIAIDEAREYDGSTYTLDLSDVVAAHDDARNRYYNLVVAIAHYSTVRFILPAESDRLTPPGVEFPSHVARIIANNIPRRDVFPEDGHGDILESAEAWFNWINVARAPGPLGDEDCRVAMVLDISGSISQANYLSVPDETIALLEERFPELETRLRYQGDERWLKWAADEWRDFIESRQ